MKPKKNRSAERLETRNLLAADVGFNEDPFLPPPPDAEFGPPALVDQAGPFGPGAPPRLPDGQLPPRPGQPSQADAEPIEVRNLDGTENNLEDPTLGAVDTELLRLSAVEYANGISEPAGADRPSAREVSNAVAAQTTTETNDRDLTDITWVWGQFIDHDIDLTEGADPAEPFDIEVLAGDIFFDPTGTGEEVISFNRSVYGTDTGTSTDDPREQINQITAFLDGSVIYGSDEERAAELRSFEGGLLATSEADLLPFNEAGLDNAGGTSDTLFLAGDVRANENAALTSMHTLWVREHNYWASELAAEDPSLTDEALYQEAKAIVTAELQAITYNEYLPALLGEDAVSTYEGYDSSVDPSISNEFSTAIYRFGHSMLSTELLRLEHDGTTAEEGNLSLQNAFFAPGEITDNGIDSLLLGVTAQVANEIDTQVVDAIRNFLFGEPGSGGFDLASLNIQRGRDHGLADYNQTREDLGLGQVTDFSEITSDTQLAAKLEQLYGDVDNIDLWVGALAEDHLPGSSVGELTSTVIADQFERIRDGDRLWYENVFSGQALREIDNTTLADVIERNTDVTGLQENVFFDAAEQPETDDPDRQFVDGRSDRDASRPDQQNDGPMQTPPTPGPGPMVAQAGNQQQQPDLASRKQPEVPAGPVQLTGPVQQAGLAGTPFDTPEIAGCPRDIDAAETAEAATAIGRAGTVAGNPQANDQVQRNDRLQETPASQQELSNPAEVVDEAFSDLGETGVSRPLDQQLFARRDQGRRRG